MKQNDTDFIIGLILPRIQGKFDEAIKIDDIIKHNIVFLYFLIKNHI